MKEEIGYECFYGTTAAKVYIPQSVTTIESHAFSNCENVDIYIPKSVINMPKDQKWGIIENAATSNITIYTTEGSYAEEYAKEFGI